MGIGDPICSITSISGFSPKEISNTISGLIKSFETGVGTPTQSIPGIGVKGTVIDRDWGTVMAIVVSVPDPVVTMVVVGTTD